MVSIFQSTFPRGERPNSLFLLNQIILISIHVPAWGTTILFAKNARKSVFQSTFPRGERPEEHGDSGYGY